MPRAGRSTRSATSWAHRPDRPVKTLPAGQAYYTNGPLVHPENLSRYNGMARFILEPTPESKLTTTYQGYAADWDGSGQIPAPQVASGALDRFGSVDPTEGGRTDRQNLILDWRYTPSAVDTWEVYTYATRYKLRLWSDFTFFSNSGLRFVQFPGGGIEDTGDEPVRPSATYLPGDQIYQGDSRYMYGGHARYTRNWFLRGLPMQSLIAFERRNDDIQVTLKRAIRRTSFFTVNDVYVREHSFSGYWAQQIFFTDWLRFEGGIRGDFFVFDVNNRLPERNGPELQRRLPGRPHQRGTGEPEGEPDHHARREHRDLHQLRTGISLQRRARQHHRAIQR